MNYTGDRLNFGLAIEMARNIHNYRNVRMLIVDDDCSIDNPRQSTGRRGLAGIILVHKISGAMSLKGASLNEIHNFCTSLLNEQLIRTIGFAFHHDKSNGLTDIEIGYGIHGEPGSIRLEKEPNFKPIISIMKEKLRLNDVRSDSVLLFNNLGGTSEYIFYQFVKEFLELVKGSSFNIVRVYAGKFLTSLSKEALSVTIMEVHDPKVLEYLTESVVTPAGYLFNNPFELCNPEVREFLVPETVNRQTVKAIISESEVALVVKVIEKACTAAIEMKQVLNDMDGELGDGDTGSTVSRGAQALLQALMKQKVHVADPLVMLLDVSKVLMDAMGGTSGAIFSIFFQFASKAFSEDNLHSIENWMKALRLGMNGIMEHGRSNVGDRTLLDAMHYGYEAVEDQMVSNPSSEAREVLEAFTCGCYAGVEKTKTMNPKSGRSAYSVSDKGDEFKFKSEHPDPGAYAISRLAKAINEAYIECFMKAT